MRDRNGRQVDFTGSLDPGAEEPPTETKLPRITTKYSERAERMVIEQISAAEFLLLLAQKVRDGEIACMDFVVNPSANDPCRMLITISTTRASPDAVGIQALEAVTPKKEAVSDQRRRYEMNRRIRQIREYAVATGKAPPVEWMNNLDGELLKGPLDGRLYLDMGLTYFDDDGVKWPYGQGPLYPKNAPPKPQPEPKKVETFERVEGVRQLDLD